METIRGALVAHPEIALFVALGLGFLIGKVSVRGIGLGAVTGTLLVGVVIGALVGEGLQIPSTVKQLFFLLFLFALGYKLGPQFVAGLRGTGLPQAVFAVLTAVVGFLATIAVSTALGYNPGIASGLAGGGLTQSAIIGVAQDAIAGLPVDPAVAKQWSALVPVAYAVTYLFGTVGAALYISFLAPRLLGIRDVAAASRDLESALGAHDEHADSRRAYHRVSRRAYRLLETFRAQTVEDFEGRSLARTGSHLYIARVRRGDEVLDAAPDLELLASDVVAVSTFHSTLIASHLEEVATEVDDAPLLDFPIESLGVVITKKEVVGKTIRELRADPRSRRLFLTDLIRAGHALPVAPGTVLSAGDEVRVQGPLPLLEQAIPHLGYPERTDPRSDMVTVALGVAIGAAIGIPAVVVGGVPLSLTTSVGALLVGLLLGWWRSKSPTFGHIPPGAQWFFETVGLTLFVAAVGINAGPGFIAGLRDYGVTLFLAGVVVTLVPLVVMTLVGRFAFRRTPPVLILGMLAGAMTTTAAVGTLRETAKSSAPLLGFTVPYAIGNIVLTIGGAVVVAVIRP